MGEGEENGGGGQSGGESRAGWVAGGGGPAKERPSNGSAGGGGEGREGRHTRKGKRAREGRRCLASIRERDARTKRLPRCHKKAQTLGSSGSSSEEPLINAPRPPRSSLFSSRSRPLFRWGGEVEASFLCPHPGPPRPAPRSRFLSSIFPLFLTTRYFLPLFAPLFAGSRSPSLFLFARLSFRRGLSSCFVSRCRA